MKRLKKLAPAVLLAVLTFNAAEASAVPLAQMLGAAASAVTSSDTSAAEDNFQSAGGVPAPYDPKPDAETIAARAAEIEILFDEWSLLKPAEAAARFGVTEKDVSLRLETLTSLKNSYPGIVNALNRKKLLDAELSKLQADTSPPGLSLTERPPYTMAFYDSVINTIDNLDKQIADAQEDLRRTTLYAESTQKQIFDREAAWRLARHNVIRDENDRTKWTLLGASLLLESARAQNVGARLVKDNAATALAAKKLEKDHEAAVQKYVRDNLDLSDDSFAAQTAELLASSKKLEATRTDLTRLFKQAEDDADAALLKYEAEKGNPAKAAAAALERDTTAALRERRRLQLDHLQTGLIVISLRRRVWTDRCEIHRGVADKTRIPQVIKEMTSVSKWVDDELTSVQKELLSLQSQHSAVQKRITAAENDPDARSVLYKHRAALQACIDTCLAVVSDLLGIGAQVRDLVAEVEETYKTVPVWEKYLTQWRQKGTELLNTELWQSGGYAVRLKEFLWALALIVLGSWGAQHAIAMLLWTLSKRFHIDETRQRSLSRLLACVANIGIFLGALHMTGIPLMAFAFLGGAAAIAVGFGAQTLFKNVIAGILLTIKRPFRLGDVVETGTVLGTVTDLGVSSTLVRTFDEKEVLIPNSELLDKQLINWSLSDALLRLTIAVDVEYGTPVSLVREALLDAANSNPRILKMPEPWVYFADFGDSALKFTLYFWINQRLASSLRVSSELREAILDSFEKRRIAMTYPRLNVTLLNDRQSKNAPAQPV